VVTGAAGLLLVAEGTGFDPPADVDVPPDVLAGREVAGLAGIDVGEDADEEDDAELVVGELFATADPGPPVAVGLCCGEAAVSADPPLVHIIVPVVTNATATTAEPMATLVVVPMRRPARCPLSRMSSRPFP
jgi:hypothetical protein